MSKKVKSITDLEIGTTYKCCNYDLVFESMYMTPIEVKDKKVVFENAMRQKTIVDFEKINENKYFNYMNMYSYV